MPRGSGRRRYILPAAGDGDNLPGLLWLCASIRLKNSFKFRDKVSTIMALRSVFFSWILCMPAPNYDQMPSIWAPMMDSSLAYSE
eukprot:SAG22_NODE_214_length_15003_cov_18.466519_6_plen_85_part_00